LMMVFSDRAKNDSLVVVDKLEMGEFKTSKMNSILKNLESNLKDNAGKRSILIINEGKNKEVLNSARNLSGVEIINLENINIIDLLAKKNFILSQEAVKKIDEVYSKE
ncbi:MAG: 50S ribosomal protein L4, partial [Patescibacteria group bacterium]